MTAPGSFAEYLPLAPGGRQHIRRASVVMGCTELFVGLVLIALAEGYGALQRYWGDSSWSLNATMGVLAPLCVGGLGVGLLRIGGALAGDWVHRPRASRLTTVLRVWWIVGLVVAGLTILAQVVELVTAAQLDYAAFDLLGPMLAVATAGVGTLGYVVGRNLLRPASVSGPRVARY
jgi:hypothetical protein